VDDEPLYVNARQYHRILKRRVARAREAEVRRLSQRKVCSTPHFHTSLSLSALSSVSLDYIPRTRRHINDHLLPASRLTQLTLLFPASLLPRRQHVFAFSRNHHHHTSNHTCTSQDTTTQSGVPVVLAVVSSLQRKSPLGSWKLKLKRMPGLRNRQLAQVRAHQLLLLHKPSRPSGINPWAHAEMSNRESQTTVPPLQHLFNRRPSQRPAPVPVLARTVMADSPMRGPRLVKDTLQIRPTQPLGWHRSQHMGTNK